MMTSIVILKYRTAETPRSCNTVTTTKMAAAPKKIYKAVVIGCSRMGASMQGGPTHRCCNAPRGPCTAYECRPPLH